MSQTVFITGAAGLVGQNLIPVLKRNPDLKIVAADKHPTNTSKLAELHPDVEVIQADLAETGDWQARLADSDIAVFLHAQIGGLDEAEFTRNNVTATEICLDAMESGKTRYLVHISSSVVNSMADDFYTRSKTAQEAVVVKTDIPHVILRPTLMFGWFDRKHLGWLKRFMERMPVFPIPGNGRYLRQPLYAGDFSAIIASCIGSQKSGAFNISGQETVDYIDLIRAIKRVTGAGALVLRIPYGLFWGLLKIYALFSRNPPFTTSQLEALVTPDVFEVIDWPAIFDVEATSLDDALKATFLDPTYAKVELDF